MIDLGTLGGSFSVAEAVNDSGEVVGWAETADGALHAFSWTAAGGMVDLGTLGDRGSEASGVNASGQVVGVTCLTTETACEAHAVLWQPIANLGCDATLAGCNLRGANLAGAYLKDGDLRRANLRSANLARANLSGADLTGANLGGANLTNADLAGANLTAANVKGVVWFNTICPDGTNSDANKGTCVGHL